MKQELNEQILNDLKDMDNDEEITLEDIENIEVLFKDETMIEPPENLFNDIMDKLELVYENESLEKTKDNANVFESIRSLLLTIRLQVSLLDARFWLASFIILMFGLLNIRTNENFNIVLLGPVVSAFSIYYLYRGSYYNVFEMESACKYSMYEIAVARTIIIIFYNILFSSLMAFINYMMWDVNIWAYLIVSWLSPLLVSYYLTLYFFYKKGLVESITANVSAWSMYVLLFYRFDIIHWSKSNTNELAYINLILISVSIIMLFVLFKSMRKNCR